MNRIFKFTLLFHLLFTSAIALGQDNLGLEKSYLKAKILRGKPGHVQSLFYFANVAYKAKLYQTSTFPLVQVIRESTDKEEKQRALNLLFSSASFLEDSSMLSFALKKFEISELSKQGRESLLLKLADFAADSGEYSRAIDLLNAVLKSKPNSEEALNSLGIVFLKKGEPKSAIPLFEKLWNIEKLKKSNRKTHPLMNLARAHYQNHSWELATELYRQVKKSDPLYFDSLIELSWSLFRSGKFRSAISPLESLETPYYQNFYNPEALLLHGIILLFSCRYSDSMTIIEFFEKTYPDALTKLIHWIEAKHGQEDIAQEIAKTRSSIQNLKTTGKLNSDTVLPFFINRTLIGNPAAARELRYQARLASERHALNKMPASEFKSYAKKIIETRYQGSKNRLTIVFENELQKVTLQLQDFSNQMDFLKYETLNGLRLEAKESVGSGVQTNTPSARNREYYIQNGYKYWPVQNEYWRDEIGSYQFVGENYCEKK